MTSAEIVFEQRGRHVFDRSKMGAILFQRAVAGVTHIPQFRRQIAHKVGLQLDRNGGNVVAQNLMDRVGIDEQHIIGRKVEHLAADEHRGLTPHDKDQFDRLMPMPRNMPDPIDLDVERYALREGNDFMLIPHFVRPLRCANFYSLMC